MNLRVSGNRHDVDFWRIKFMRAPLILLDGAPVEHCREARAGSDGHVVVEVHRDGKPCFADVVFDGKIIDKVIVTRTIHGNVTIEALPERLS